MKTNRPSPTLAVLAFLVAACGGGAPTAAPGETTSGGASQGPGSATHPPAGATQPPGPGATVDPCALLADADIEAATGATVDEATSGPQFGIFASGCNWALVDEDSIVPPSIALGVMTVGGLSYYQTYFEPFNEEYGYEPVEGVGDVAVDAEAGSLLVVSGDAFFNIQYLGGGFGGDDTAIATELAKKIVESLGG